MWTFIDNCRLREDNSKQEQNHEKNRTGGNLNRGLCILVGACFWPDGYVKREEESIIE